MTAESMLMLMYMGHDRNEPGMAEGADFVLEQLPSLGDGTDMKRNSYYWYYASQAMFHMSGDYQEKWSTQFKQIADATQTKEGPAAGSWHPTKPVPDVWGQHGGRMLVTTLHLLMLELENEYRVLPLFQELGN